jgi:hypothetical protein
LSDSDIKERPAAVRKILQSTLPRHEKEVEDARESYQQGRANSREAIMLDVKLEDGSIESFPYSLLKRVRYLPGDTLVLRFGDDEVGIEGRNLAHLRDTLAEQRARFIQEGTESEEGLKPEDAAHINRIVITEGEEQ